MPKLVFCLRRQPHLSAEEFQTYWREQHGPLVAEQQRLGRMPTLQRYVQVHTRHDPATAAATASRDCQEPFDGVAELWFDGYALPEGADMAGAAEAARILLEDERTFIDLPRSVIFWADEHEVIAARA
jgi:hypothetical protein